MAEDLKAIIKSEFIKCAQDPVYFMKKYYMIQNPKNAVKLLVVLGGLVVIGFICYSLASNSFNIVLYKTNEYE